jgi:hypothetical protein
MDSEMIQEIREQFKIPALYRLEADDGINVQFCFGISTIEVDLAAGKAWESHMSFSQDEGISYLAKQEWPLKRISNRNGFGQERCGACGWYNCQC